MQKIKNFWGKIKSWSLRKKIIYGLILVVVLLVGYMILKPKDNSENITTDIAKIIDLKQTVLATGQVTSNTDLDLSFNTSGVVKNIKVEVGEKVKAGQVLATLDQGTVLADLTSAKGKLAAANAKLKKVIEQGDLSLAQIALDSAKTAYENAKTTQDTLVKNAYNNLLNSTLEVASYPLSDDVSNPSVSGTYDLGKEGKIIISVGLSGQSFETRGLVEVSYGDVSTTTFQPIGKSGLYIKFPSDETLNYTDWVIEIPNKKASNYLTNYNAYQYALETKQSILDQAKALVDQRQIEYNIILSSVNGSDIDLARADVLSAQGAVEQALARYNDTEIVAPAEGTITKIDIKIGELAQAQREAIVLQDVNNLYLETNINEANISNIKLGIPINITYDAFNTEDIYTGRVIKIDPSSTLVSGVVNYKITASIDSMPELRPGMTANMTILVGEKNNVLTIPTRAIIKDKSGSKTVRLVTNTKTKSFEEISVTTGMDGDGGMTEINSGINEGDEIVVLIKK